MNYRYEPRTFRNDRGRGKQAALTAAADALDEDPNRITTHGEIAAWLRGRINNSKLPAPKTPASPPVEEPDRP